ncbi:MULTISPECIES: carbon-nitrogen family hydrolase [Metabacillus]|jgi:omega-amidase|uniref:Carbon-nitrogen family hydrolase n=1 Tax=Metabacillus rhizolycopersici TaxID=2875709 RepID=A0ABS7UUN4_9BACI|nr:MULTISPECIES: carbon-nitrogen family hydrolase [Metabacillus]MBZ5751742.1 carbon-nitrogen family hydrolase [Metabacillus rhizolycopersici]MCM3652364.1 carbon-nitrogen family hydrolase [Metabacillus litoralis]
MQPVITCIQLDIKFGDPQFNYQQVEEKIAQTVENKKSTIIVLPELWTTGYDLTRLDEIADEKGEETKQFLSRLAKKYQINIVGGSIAKKTADNVTNTMYIFNTQGEFVHEYSKLHLFKLMDEHHYLTAGTEKGLFEIEGIKSAGVICYDIRFPEWIRAHTTQGAEVLFVVAEWPLPRLNHWRTLLTSRAIENQCYVVACNRAGSDLNNVFAGHSMIIDPWGTIIAEADEQAGSISATIDVETVKQVRSQIPVFDDRLPEFYK